MGPNGEMFQKVATKPCFSEVAGRQGGREAVRQVGGPAPDTLSTSIGTAGGHSAGRMQFLRCVCDQCNNVITRKRHSCMAEECHKGEAEIGLCMSARVTARCGTVEVVK